VTYDTDKHMTASSNLAKLSYKQFC